MRAVKGLAFCGCLLAVVSTQGCRETETLGQPLASPATAAGTGASTAGAASTAGTGGSAPATAGTPAMMAGGAAAPAATGDTDYAKPDNWLCRPGHNAVCEVNLDSTIVKADGTLEVEKYQADPNAPIDCFYVYPTVSLDATPNSDLVPGDEEKNVVRAQFARLGSQCRLYAPLYRQVTLTALRASLSGMATTPAPDRTLGYKDVLAAWKYYLEHDNQGRGVVLVSHSQGSSVLTQLIKENLDQPTLDKRFMSALLIGTTITAPKDAVVGGTFKNVPLCKTADQLGCIITYASFRSNVPPPASSLFATSMDPNLVGVCTNPGALGGGKAELHSYLTATGSVSSSAPTPPWTTPEKPITTPFVSVPGLITAECKMGMTGSYLEITVNGNPMDARVDDIVGDVLTNGEVQANWGLHVIDMHLAMGDFVDIVKAQSAKFRAK